MEQNLNPDAVTLTKTLCAHLTAARFTDLSPAAQREARRGVLDWIGCALAAATFIEQLHVQGLEPVGGPPEEARERLASEVPRWSRIIREAGIKAQ